MSRTINTLINDLKKCAQGMRIEESDERERWPELIMETAKVQNGQQNLQTNKLHNNKIKALT